MLKIGDETEDLGQAKLAALQGQAYERALQHMAHVVAKGDSIEKDDYIVCYAIEDPEGLYRLEDDRFVWTEPTTENVHLEVAVQDRITKRFLPYCIVNVDIIRENETILSVNKLPFLWHPWLYHYGSNVIVPDKGTYDLNITVFPPQISRHDKKNGMICTEKVEVCFAEVELPFA